jgi:beta-N-acetylhexosaminidase
MLIVSPDAITGVSGTTIPGATTKAALEKYPVGGFIQFSPNIKDSEQILAFNTTVQAYSKIPLFIGIDEEGGRVGRLNLIGAHSVGAMMTYAADGEEVAFENAKTLSAALKKHGFNLNFAPVADVLSNPRNTVIGDRAYSTDFDGAAVLVASAVGGFHAENIACTLKHFPGHGDTREDSHSSVAYISKSIDELRGNEFKPFAAGIAAGADLVMVGHLVVPSADGMPASMSETFVTDILRGELGFGGAVITDSLAMSPISSNYGAQQIAVTAVKAGIDILLMPPDIDATI